jgi:hypothetical protein
MENYYFIISAEKREDGNIRIIFPDGSECGCPEDIFNSTYVKCNASSDEDIKRFCLAHAMRCGSKYSSEKKLLKSAQAIYEWIKLKKSDLRFNYDPEFKTDIKGAH